MAASFFDIPGGPELPTAGSGGSGGGAAVWGQITGTLASQTDLEARLVAAAASGSLVTMTETTAGDGSTQEVQRLNYSGTGSFQLEGQTVNHDDNLATLQTKADSMVAPEVLTPTFAGGYRQNTWPTLTAGQTVVAVTNSSTTPSGWTLKDNQTQLYVYTYTATGSESGTIHASWNTNFTRLAVYDNADEATIDVQNATETGNGFTLTAPAITPDASSQNVLIAVGIASNGDTTPAATTGYTRIGADGSAGVTDFWRYDTSVAAGALHTPTIGFTENDDGSNTVDVVTIAVYGKSTSNVTVSGTQGTYDFTWRENGARELLTLSNIQLVPIVAVPLNGSDQMTGELKLVDEDPDDAENSSLFFDENNSGRPTWKASDGTYFDLVEGSTGTIPGP